MTAIVETEICPICNKLGTPDFRDGGRLSFIHGDRSCSLGEPIQLGKIEYDEEKKCFSCGHNKLEDKWFDERDMMYRRIGCPRCGNEGSVSFNRESGGRFFVRHGKELCYMEDEHDKLLVATNLVLIYGEERLRKERIKCPKCNRPGLLCGRGKYMEHGRINGKHDVCRLSR